MSQEKGIITLGKNANFDIVSLDNLWRRTEVEIT